MSILFYQPFLYSVVKKLQTQLSFFWLKVPFRGSESLYEYVFIDFIHHYQILNPHQSWPIINKLPHPMLLSWNQSYFEDFDLIHENVTSQSGLLLYLYFEHIIKVLLKSIICVERSTICSNEQFFLQDPGHKIVRIIVEQHLQTIWFFSITRRFTTTEVSIAFLKQAVSLL